MKIESCKVRTIPLLGVTCYAVVAISPGPTGDVDMKEATYVGKV